MSEDERLPSELEALLEAERDIDAPEKDQRARLLARLGPLVIPGAIGAGVGAAAAVTSSSAETAATGKAASVLGAGLKAKLAVAVIAGAVGAVGGAVTQSALGPAPEPKPAPAASARTAPPPPVETASVSPPPEAPPSATASPAPAPSASAPSRAGSGAAKLRTERLLLERATAALLRGDSSAALGALREHAQKFPRGELSEEREVLLVRALRAAGQNDAAEKRAKDFKRQFPSSLQQGIIDAAPSKE